MGHLIRMLMGRVNFAGLRTGGLWLSTTLRALNAPGVHERPGPQRRVSNTIDRFWSAGRCGGSTQPSTGAFGMDTRTSSSRPGGRLRPGHGDSTETPHAEENTNRDNSSAGGPFASPSEDVSATRGSSLLQSRRGCDTAGAAPTTH